MKMNHSEQDLKKIKFLSRDSLYQQLKNLSSGMAVTNGSFEHRVENCLLEDVEWNHMDQMHRLAIHNTYEKGVRIACGKDFAVSLTQWSKWPFLITVSDVYVDKGLFYQSLTIAGFIFIHSIISLEQVGNDVVLKDEWFITSHKLFKFLHPILNKKLLKLNARLQDEDKPVRQGRLVLRQKGYRFKTDRPDYLNSNLLGQHTIYPDLTPHAEISLNEIVESPRIVQAGGVEYLVRKIGEVYQIWPAACPHEGGPLLQGKLCADKIICPWHGLKFSAAELSMHHPRVTRYGFEYELMGNHIAVRKTEVVDLKCRIAAENEAAVV